MWFSAFSACSAGWISFSRSVWTSVLCLQGDTAAEKRALCLSAENESLKHRLPVTQAPLQIGITSGRVRVVRCVSTSVVAVA